MHSRRSDGRVAAGCRAAVRTGGFSARERGGAREYAGPRVGYSRCGAARRSRHRRRDSWPTLSHVGDFFPDVAAARAGSRGGRLCCLRSPRRVVRRREASPFSKDEQYPQKLLVGFRLGLVTSQASVASVLKAARLIHLGGGSNSPPGPQPTHRTPNKLPNRPTAKHIWRFTLLNA